MYSRRSELSIWLPIGVAIASVIAVIVFAFLFFVVWPENAYEKSENKTVMANGEEVDPLVAKVGNIENAYIQQSKAMINGSYGI